VWTGSEMIVWGGVRQSVSRNTGARYDPATDTWTPTSTGSGAPTPRSRHTAGWTRSEMSVWGGTTGIGDGARYDPRTDTWTPISLAGAPQARSDHTAVWTGGEMIVWGSESGALTGDSHLNSGGRYDPVHDTWAATTVTGAPFAR